MPRCAGMLGTAAAEGHPFAMTRRVDANRRRCLVGSLFWLLAACGCTAWKDPTSPPLQLPAHRLSPDSVGLEITFVRVPAGNSSMTDELWERVDEQCVDAKSRMELNRNGFRAGLVGSQLPESLRRLLDEQKQQNQLDRLVSSETDVLAQNRQLQNRSGQRSEIVAGPPQPEMVALYKAEQQAKITGKTFRDAQCILATRCFPQNDGSVRMELIPEVHHGEPRKQWVAGEGTFHLLSGREREVFAELKMHLTLQRGQTLVLSSTPETKGLGQNFFIESGRGATQQKIFLVRLSQTQRDELFDAPQEKKPGQAAELAGSP
jgi:hypothetical protein